LDPQQLLQFAQDMSGAGRARLAGAVSSFFEERELTEREQRLASEILLNLIRQAETDLREALAERLAALDNVPVELIVFLANDDISVARPVLLHSPILNDIDLVYIITAKGHDHWRTIASRESLSPVVADRLIDTQDPGAILNLIDNERVHLQKGSMKKLVRASIRSEELHAPLLRRPEVDAEVASDLYMIVSQALRRDIMEKFAPPVEMIEKSMEALVDELCHESHGERFASPEMTALAQRLQERGGISPEILIRTLRRGQTGFFVALFAERAGFAPEQVVRMIQKEHGRHFIVACRSLGMMKSEFASIFLLSRGVRTGDKIVDQRELAMALRQFDTLKDFDVARIMKSWLKNPEML
jgi:uncharacterized protein (DUF2336 family)